MNKFGTSGIRRHWKSTAIGIVFAVGVLALVFFEKATLTEASAALPVVLGAILYKGNEQ